MENTYRFRPLSLDELPRMLDLIHQRIAWMDEVGIRQWNVTDYDGVYPLAYYEECWRKGEMYALEKDGCIVCVGALKEEDPRWPDNTAPAFYLHHLAADLACKGAGRIYLREAEQHAYRMGKQYLRLDSAIDNPALTRYYESRGYLPAGSCIDGLYEGVLRQKPLAAPEK